MKLAAILSATALALAGAGAGTASAATLYENDFSSGLNGFSTTGTGAILSENGESYIGYLTQGSAAFTSIDVSGYTNLKLSFDLYAVASLDGNGPDGGGPDPFVVKDSVGTIFDYTFANYFGSNKQSFGGVGQPAGLYDPRTGASGSNRLGRGSGDFGDYEYSFSDLALTPNGDSLTLAFLGNSGQGIGDEFYGIDNVKITGDLIPSGPAVPEPATWAMMIGGLGVAGAAMRRRRATSVRVAYA